MTETNEEITYAQLQDIWFQQFATLAKSSGVDQHLIADAMLTVALCRMVALTPDPETISARLAMLSGGMHAAAREMPKQSQH